MISKLFLVAVVVSAGYLGYRYFYPDDAAEKVKGVILQTESMEEINDKLDQLKEAREKQKEVMDLLNAE